LNNDNNPTSIQIQLFDSVLGLIDVDFSITVEGTTLDGVGIL
jgi:hypothetical protein